MNPECRDHPLLSSPLCLYSDFILTKKALADSLTGLRLGVGMFIISLLRYSPGNSRAVSSYELLSQNDEYLIGSQECYQASPY